ncbi:ABC transporter permease [Micromonospora globbae]|uniref:ABC transporter permease n=1 Tax=Micromonospora globbae TaxID=1894969 RepID=A0A420F0F3_9ACTN|nr:ABC transporter permease [Micromonospora globbae]RKF26485.1 ABC transporter permease [Micromonospora globbae]WTF83307.1 ABC transporter permease [Micromonospora globbae]
MTVVLPTSAPPAAEPALHELARAPRRRGRVLRVPRWLRALSGPALLIALWWLASATGVLNPQLFPPPAAVAATAARLAADGELQTHVGASVWRVLQGTAYGVLGGGAVAVLAGLSRVGADVIDSTMQVAKAVPNFALTPLLIMWMGIDEGPKVLLIALGVGIAIYINTYSAIRGVDAQLVEAATTLGVGRAAMVLHVILPGALPGFLVGLRLALSSAWLSLIFAETINTTEGIGFLMARAQTLLQFDLSVLVLLLYAVIGLLSYALVRFLERRLLGWRRGFEGA